MENPRHCLINFDCFTIDESSKNSSRNHAVAGLFFKNCSGDDSGGIIVKEWYYRILRCNIKGNMASILRCSEILPCSTLLFY